MGLKKNMKEVKRLNEKDPASLELRMCKIAEEFGEMAQAFNKTTGRKYLKKGDTPKNIRKNILEEGVDTMQCIISFLVQCGFDRDDIIRVMKKKNKAWERAIVKKTRTARHAKKGHE